MSNTVTPRSAKELIKGAKRQRRSARVNLAGHLVAQVELLEAELRELMDADAAKTGNSQRLASKSASAATTAKAGEIEALQTEMADSWLALELEPQSFADWRKFKADNPPREGDDYDTLIGLNFDALAEKFLPKCVVEPQLDAEDWRGLFEKVAPGDIRDLAALVFNLHEVGVDVPKSLLASEARQKNAAASARPASGA